MSIKGFLSDFSVPELFGFIGQGYKSGRLAICSLPSSPEIPAKCYYIWVKRGRIVAAANRLDGQGLLSLIAQQHWLSQHVITKLVEWCCPVDKPLGICFKNHGVLQKSQLQQLFLIQISQQLEALLKLKEGHFEFEQNVLIPGREMTGINFPLRSICSYFHADVLRIIKLMKVKTYLEEKAKISQESRSEQFSELSQI